MLGYIHIQSLLGNSGEITLTNDYLVIKGKHYNFRDWYINKSADNVSIQTKDILSMDFVSFRSKRLLVIFVVMASLMVTLGRWIYRINSAIFLIFILACAFTLIMHLCYVRPLYVITAKGISVALDVGCYDRRQLQYLTSCWNNQF